VQAGEGTDWDTETLSGDWNGARNSWSEKGVNADLLFKGIVMDNPAGGIRQGTDYMQNLELKIGLDTVKLWNIPDSAAYIHIILNSGGKMNAAYVGSQMGIANIEVPDNTAKLYQGWFNKYLFNSTLSILVGVYPVDAEFYVTDSSGVFLHPSFGVGAEISQTGKNGPSIYPISSLGMRIKYQPLPVFYVQAAVLDGDPGESHNPHWVHFNPFHGDGSLFVSEMGYLPDEANQKTAPEIDQGKEVTLTKKQKLEDKYRPISKVAIGYWSYSKSYDDLVDSDPAGNPLQRTNQGTYLLMENSVYRSEDRERDAAIFVRYGRAEKDVNTFDYSASTGLRVRGLIAGRADDFFGIAATRANASKKFQLAQKFIGINIPGNETAVEVTYRAQLKPWLVMQPNVQRIFNPGLAPALKNVTLIGLQCEIAL